MGNNMQFLTTNKFEHSVVSVTSGSLTNGNPLDGQRRTYWTSVGTDDATTEEYIVELATAVTFDTIFLIDNNIKTGNLQYWNGSDWTAFSTPAVWTSTTQHNRFEFTAVSATKVRLQATTTEVANAEKYVAMLYIGLQKFELTQNPNEAKPESVINGIKNYAQNGLLRMGLHGYDIGNFSLSWNNLGASDTATDYANIIELIRTRESFVLNMCGDTQQSTEPFKWSNIKKVSITNESITTPLSSKCFSGGYNVAIQLEQMR